MQKIMVAAGIIGAAYRWFSDGNIRRAGFLSGVLGEALGGQVAKLATCISVAAVRRLRVQQLIGPFSPGGEHGA